MKSTNFYMTRKEVAVYLRVSIRTVDRWRKGGEIQGVRLGNRRRYSLEEIEDLVRRLRAEEADHA